MHKKTNTTTTAFVIVVIVTVVYLMTANSLITPAFALAYYFNCVTGIANKTGKLTLDDVNHCYDIEFPGSSGKTNNSSGSGLGIGTSHSGSGHTHSSVVGSGHTPSSIVTPTGY